MWEILPKPNGAEVRLSGRIERADVEAANRAVYDLVPRDVAAYALFDLGQVSEFLLTGEDLRSIAEFDAAIALRFPHLATVILAPLDALFGIGRQWQLQADGVASVVVRTREEAADWLAMRGLTLS